MIERKTSTLGLVAAIGLGVASFFSVQTLMNSTSQTAAVVASIASQDAVIDMIAQHQNNISEIIIATNDAGIDVANIIPTSGEQAPADTMTEHDHDHDHDHDDMHAEDQARSTDTDSVTSETKSMKAVDSLKKMEESSPLMSIRAIGSIDAPVVMEEFSSLTCPHCAAFHTDTLPAIKAKYIDTGKLRLIFRDYPLNPPALQAAGVARCMPEDQYYDFVTVLFETQEEWATANSADKLLQTAKLAGLDHDSLEACISNRDLVKFMLASMRQNGQDHEIQSTPTFVLNDGEEKIKGNRSIEEFSKVIDSLIIEAEKKNDTAE